MYWSTSYVIIRAGAPAEVMNAKALSGGALKAAESSGAGTLLETFRDIHHEIHRRAGEGNRCVELHCLSRAVDTLKVHGHNCAG